MAYFQRLQGSALYFLFLTTLYVLILKLNLKTVYNSTFKLKNRNDKAKITKPWIFGILMLESKNYEFFDRGNVLSFIISIIYFKYFITIII